MAHEHDRPDPPHVTRDELRDALARPHGHAARGPSALLEATPEPAGRAAWDWDSEDRAELEALREERARLAETVDSLQRAERAWRERERDLHEGMRALAAAPVWRRGKVRAGLRTRGLL
jgi:hypothetical protein